MKKKDSEPKKSKKTQEKDIPLSDLFDGVEDTVVDQVEKKSGYKLDIFKALLAINRKEWDFYKNLDDEEKKGYAMPVIMRWLACPDDKLGITEAQLYLINRFVNKDFWLSTKHPDMVHRLFCAIGSKKLTRSGMNYAYVKATGNRKIHSIDHVLLSCNPRLGNDELAVIKSKLNRDKYIEFLKDMGKQDKVINELVAEYDKYEKK